MRAFSTIFIEISLVRQEGLEPPTFGSGGQRRPLYQSLFLLSLSQFLFSPGAIWVRKCRRKVLRVLDGLPIIALKLDFHPQSNRPRRLETQRVQVVGIRRNWIVIRIHILEMDLVDLSYIALVEQVQCIQYQ